MSYVDEVLEVIAEKNPNEPEFCQAVKECLNAVRPLVDANEEIYRENAILERITEPDRMIVFSVPWIDRNGKVQINRGWRVQFNNAIGTYKGGLRFHRTVNTSVMKCLAFEMILKNSLTGLPMGGAKGGSDFDPKGKTDREVMSFCQNYMNELFKYIGANMDCPTGDIGVGGREIGYLFGQYKKLTSSFEGSLSGKGISFGGSEVRTEATGYGLAYMVSEICTANRKAVEGKTVTVTGAGNVAFCASEKLQQMGAKIVAMSDSGGYIHDPAGIRLDVIRQVKTAEHRSLSEYAGRVEGSVYTEGKGIWNIPCDIYLPCATQYEISVEAAKTLVDNGVFLVAEGANLPTHPKAVEYFQKHEVLFMPGKAASAGGVSVSGLEQTQNAQRLPWSFEEVDEKLKEIMHGIFVRIDECAKKYGVEKNYLAGANIYAVERVAGAMIAQGIT